MKASIASAHRRIVILVAAAGSALLIALCVLIIAQTRQPAFHTNPAPEPLEYDGLSEAERRQLFWEMREVDFKSDVDAERLAPVPDPLSPGYTPEKADPLVRKHWEINHQLLEQYREQWKAERGVSDKLFWQIYADGCDNDWPEPENPSLELIKDRKRVPIH